MKLRSLLRHLTRHREGYLWLPLCLLGIYLAILFVSSLTGRQVLDDPGAIVGWLYACFRAVLVIFAAAQVQEHVVGFRAEYHERRKGSDGQKEEIPLSSDIFDFVVTITLLCFFAYLLQ